MENTTDGLVTTTSSKAIYSTEAYYALPNPLLPMGEFVAELMDAHSEEEVEIICAKYNVDQKQFERSPRYAPWMCASRIGWWPDDATEAPLSFASWLFVHMKTISEILKLYAVCLPVARQTSKNDKTKDIFIMLHQAQTTQQQMIEEVYHTYEWITDDRARRGRIAHKKRELLQLPLVELFASFQDEFGRKLQKEYGYDFKKVRRRPHSPPQCHFYYWDNPNALDKARLELWSYTGKHRTEEDHYILKRDAKGLALRYIGLLDRYIEDELHNVRVQIDSISGTAKMVVDGGLTVALNLWIFTQIQAQKKYRVCKMCGNLFALGVQPEKKYCDLHKKYEIAYYSRTVREICAETDPREEESTFMACV